MSTTVSTPIGEQSPAPTPAPTPVPAPPPPPDPPPPDAPPIASAEEWAADAEHTIWTHGGKRIVIRIPDLFEMVRTDSVPEQLRGIALKLVQTEIGADTAAPAEGETGLTWEAVKDATELYEALAFGMVVRPELTTEQFRRLPTEDREMLRDIAMRQRNTDARGVVLGVMPLSLLDTFRLKHECAPDCPSCAEAVDELSTRRQV